MSTSFGVSGEWSKYIDPDGQFEILMPDTVVESRTTTETPVGVLEYVSYSSLEESAAGNTGYTLSYCTYPEGTLHQDSTELVNLFFDETISGAVESVHGKLIYSNRMKISGYPGLLWKIESVENQIHVKSKALVVGNTYYCLQVNTSKAMSIHNDGEKFFNSFKLINQ